MEETDDATRKIVERLKACRVDNDSLPEEALKERLSATLKETLAGLPSDKADKTVASIRAALVGEARRRQERIQVLEGEVDSLKRERDDLRAKLSQPRPPQPGDLPGRGENVVGRIRRALLQLAKDGTLTQETVTLSAEDLQLLQLVEILYQFALRFTSSTQRFILQGGFDFGRSILVDFERVVRETFTACAEGQPDSLRRLRELLEQASRFLPELHNAYQASIRSGTREILGAINPQAAAESNSGRFGGVNYEAAWKALKRAHDDIDGETPDEIWEHFFQPTWQSELKTRTQSAPPKR